MANRSTENRVADDKKKETAETNTNEEWRNFQPTDPDTLKKQEESGPLLEKIVHNRKNTDKNILF